jgi:type II secretory pathway component PulF
MSFVAKVIDSEGNARQEELPVARREEALQHCREQGWTVLDLQAKDRSQLHHAKVRRGWEPFGIRSEVVNFLTRQMAELTSAGITLVQTLQTLQRFCPSGKLQDVMGAVINDISSGQTFSAALAKHPRVFDRIYVNTVQVGERTGRLPDMLAQLAEYRERDAEVRSKIKSALSYPVFILIFCLLLTYGLVAYLLPGFMPMFNQAGLNLKNYPITLGLISLSNMTHNLWDEILLVGCIALLLYLYRRATSTQAGRKARDSTLYHAPILGDFVQLGVNARMCQTLALMHDAGEPMYRAVATAADVSGNALVESALKEAQAEIEAGKGLSAALSNHEEAFPPLLVQMVAVGEQTGNVGRMLSRLGRYYEAQLDTAVRGFSSVIEPVMMIGVGGIVFVFVLGVFLPIMGIVSALNNQM